MKPANDLTAPFPIGAVVRLTRALAIQNRSRRANRFFDASSDSVTFKPGTELLVCSWYQGKLNGLLLDREARPDPDAPTLMNVSPGLCTLALERFEKSKKRPRGKRSEED